MNILVLSDYFPPLSNFGAEKIALAISIQYIKLGHSVCVITIDENLKDGEIRKSIYHGIEIHYIGSSYSRYLTSWISLYNWKIMNTLSGIIKKNIYSFAHVHNIHGHLSYAVLAILFRLKINTILTMHDAMSIEYGKFTQGINPLDLSVNPKVNKKINPFISFYRNKRIYNPFRNLVIKHYLKYATKIVSVSKEQQSLLAKNGIHKLITINNGIDCNPSLVNRADVELFMDKHRLRSDDIILLWAGRISDTKGGIQIITVLKKLIKENPRVKLMIAGVKGSMDKGLTSHVIQLGLLSEKEMMIAYSLSKLTLVPSICYDMFPTVVIESMCLGTPVIATCFGGSKEAIVNGLTGYIVNPFNTDVFFKRINAVLKNDDLYKEMCKNSIKEFQDKFTIKKCAQSYLNLVKEL